MAHDATTTMSERKETTPLLRHESEIDDINTRGNFKNNDDDDDDDDDDGDDDDATIIPSAQRKDFAPQYVLPIALLSALAMASTAATSYYAFATLLCKDPHRCEGHETARYAGFVATATCTANILGMSALGHLQKLSTTNRRLGLLLWMVCRSMSAVFLLAGVSVKSIYIALSARVFEGLASDNLLHFNLNAIYAQSPSKDKASSLISYSLALYMIGISVSPFVAGFFSNLTTSFFMAIGLFLLAILYIQLFLPASAYKTDKSRRKGQGTGKGTGKGKGKATITSSQQQDESRAQSRQNKGLLGALTTFVKTVVSPLEPLQKRPTHLFVGFSLFLYNVIQSYIFDALLVHTSMRFGFSARENGLILTTVHSIAALYIFASLYLMPRISARFEARGWAEDARDRYSIMAQISLVLQVFSLTALGLAHEARQIYPIAVLLSFGLPIPAFIKAFFLRLFESDERPAALAVLAMMETVGSVIGPVLLGGLQSYLSESGGVFFAAAGLGGASFVMLSIGASVIRSVSNSMEAVV